MSNFLYIACNKGTAYVFIYIYTEPSFHSVGLHGGSHVLGPTSSPSASPKSVELPENQLHSELFGMKHLGFWNLFL